MMIWMLFVLLLYMYFIMYDLFLAKKKYNCCRLECPHTLKFWLHPYLEGHLGDKDGKYWHKLRKLNYISGAY